MSGQVHGAKCASCGVVSYPQHAVCPNCRGETFESIEISGEGKVLTFTDVYALAIDYETRYLRLAIVELDSGIRVTGQLLGDEPRLGERVTTSIGVVRKRGAERICGLQFVPAGGSS
jgi:uncharacterized OB-fold protein